jgi:pyridinium-3,5-biscarboxylic acid mononucleotide sulfurtransferase
MDCEHKLQELKKKLAEKDRILIPFSGGVDSSLLAKVANDVLGENALCAILDSETMPRSELESAKSIARSLGINCQVVNYSIFDDPKFMENAPDRCYLCKKESARILKTVAAQEGISCIADGVNLSDCSDFRPGILASNEEGIWHPFVEIGISKEDIREMAKKMGLAFWSKPSSACLSSRIPYGDQITKENLAMVEKAEDYLKSLGLGQARVRVHGKIARIEVQEVDMEKVLQSREQTFKRLKEIGFQYIALDLQGFRSGSMNEILQKRSNES